MRKMLAVIVVAALAGSAAMAGEAPKADKAAKKWAVEQPVAKTALNNVILMDASGKRTALCCCGAEVTVTAETPTYERGGTTYYLCGEGCREVSMKATDEEHEKTLTTWRPKYDQANFATNSWMAGEKTMAQCACGAEFTVTESAPVIVENGLVQYCCGTGCHEMLLKQPASERMAKEISMIKMAREAEAAK